MKSSSLIRVGGFVVLAALLVFVLGLAFPHNRAYGSIALAMYSFFYTCITRVNAPLVWFYGFIYMFLLVVDSRFGIHVLTDPKSSESIAYPVIHGVIIIGLLFSGLGFKRFVLYRLE